MPELPEVETMVRGLRPALLGATLREVEVLDDFLLVEMTSDLFIRRAGGAQVERVDRRGKWVVIQCADDRGWIVIQPRMTGGFWRVPPPRPEHIRLIFRTSGTGETVWFCDSRRLGKIAWYPNDSTAQAAFARSQGPDALVITKQELRDRLRGTSRGIKATLMDQKVLAGIGNIYADEILYQSRIHPSRVASGLKATELTRLHRAIGEILNHAIAVEGSTFDAGYRTVLGLEGGFLATNAMYGRGGQPCPGCGEPIERARIAGLIGRSSYFCPRCQPLPKA